MDSTQFNETDHKDIVTIEQSPEIEHGTKEDLVMGLTLRDHNTNREIATTSCANITSKFEALHFEEPIPSGKYINHSHLRQIQGNLHMLKHTAGYVADMLHDADQQMKFSIDYLQQPDGTVNKPEMKDVTTQYEVLMVNSSSQTEDSENQSLVAIKNILDDPAALAAHRAQAEKMAIRSLNISLPGLERIDFLMKLRGIKVLEPYIWSEEYATSSTNQILLLTRTIDKALALVESYHNELYATSYNGFPRRRRYTERIPAKELRGKEEDARILREQRDKAMQKLDWGAIEQKPEPWCYTAVYEDDQTNYPSGSRTIATQTFESIHPKRTFKGCSNCRNKQHNINWCPLPLREDMCKVCGADGFTEETCIFPHRKERDYYRQRCSGCGVHDVLFNPDCRSCNQRFPGYLDWYRNLRHQSNQEEPNAQ